MKAGIIPKSHSNHKIFGPDTIYNTDKAYDFTNDFKNDVVFHSQSSEYDDPLGPHGFSCQSWVTITDSLMTAAAYKGANLDIIQYGDIIDDQLNWNNETSTFTILFNQILSTRGIIDKLYYDKTGYIGIKYGRVIGWVKIRVEGCSKIIIYESVVE